MGEKDYILRGEHEEFARRMKAENDAIREENARQNHRLDSLEKTVSQMNSLTISMEKMATNMEYMAKEQARQGQQLVAQDEKLDRQNKKIDDLKMEPGRKWNKLIYALIGAIGSAIGAAIIAMLAGVL